MNYAMQYERLLVAGFFSSLCFLCVDKTYSFAIFGLCVSLNELQMCMAFAPAIFCLLVFLWYY